MPIHTDNETGPVRKARLWSLWLTVLTDGNAMQENSVREDG